MSMITPDRTPTIDKKVIPPNQLGVSVSFISYLEESEQPLLISET